MEREALLQISGLGFAYEEDPVLRGLDLVVPAGDFLAIVGPNGSGKSTLLRILNGILTPGQGKVAWGGKMLADMSRLEVASKIAYVPQNTGLDFQYRVIDFVLLGRNPYLNWWGRTGPEDMRVARRVMELTKTWAFRDKMMGELSGGERQRVFLARALAQEPEVLLLDEPVSHLDINYQQEIFNLLRYLNLEGLTLLVVSHDLNLAARFCSRMALFQGGDIYHLGTPAEVLTAENIARVYGVKVKLLSGDGERPVILPEINVEFAGKAFSSGNPEQFPGRRLKAHLITGGGAGKGLLNILHKMGLELSVGVLNKGDADWEEAKKLKLPVITAEPFSPVTKGEKERLQATIEECQLLIIANLPFGYGNLANLEVAAEYEGEMLLLEEEVIEKRDFTDGRAAKLWNRCKARSGSKVFRDERSLLKYILKKIQEGDG
ncbi:MAG: ABC transporter ATP-binding protein [Halanaerobium sp.]|nr:ABC transporter ATP-binding protein [Halanaerobium sp.]